MTLNDELFNLGNAITTIFTLDVIMERFVSIMNINNVKLQQLEDERIEEEV